MEWPAHLRKYIRLKHGAGPWVKVGNDTNRKPMIQEKP
mgnify:CR=1 FL=1